MSCQNCGRIGKCSTCCCNHVDHDAYPHRPCRRCEHSLTGGFDAEVIAREASDRGEDVLAAVIFQALGAASACWDNLAGAGVFESERAKAIGDNLLAYLRRRRLTGEERIPNLMPPVRSSDPSTSRAGAKDVAVRAGTQRYKLLRAYCGGLHLTADEAMRYAGLNERSCYWKRVSELVDSRYLEDTGQERKGEQGSLQRVNKITDKGKAAL